MNWKKIALLAFASASLPGCQLLWHGDSPHLAMENTADVSSPSQVALEEGRAQLSAGNLAAAAQAFQLAMRNSVTAAEASNGLGVVYARLKRFDLAERYFRMATSLEPENSQFASNLGRLQRDITLASHESPSYPVRIEMPPPKAPMPQRISALSSDGELTPLMAPNAPVAVIRSQPSSNQKVNQSAASASLDRASATEVNISIGSCLGEPPQMIVASGNPSVLKSSSKSSNPNYPVRLALK